jgi:glyoxylase-like metal-dependent hydrolase (beta-lactamase superfamily II)
MTATTLHPLIRRLTAPNPGPMTDTGTQTHIVGHGAVAVIDPGPDTPSHRDAILAATAGERIAAIVCTHTHRDHSPLAVPLAARTGALVVGCRVVTGKAFDETYRPDRVLAEGDTVAGDGWTLAAIETPGHTSNHLCFALPQADALFSGDHVMGWSTSVVIPPDGNMGDYMRSLDKLLGLDVATYYPAHGEPVTSPKRLVRGMMGHRRQREGQVLRALDQSPATIAELVEAMYVGLDPALVGAAGLSVEAHLIDLARRGMVRPEGAGWRTMT